MKVLDDTYVLVRTSSDNVSVMTNQFIQGHRTSFCDEELPFKGRSHNKVLHITIICHKRVINRVLVDDGCSLNIYPLSTLRQLRFDMGKLAQNKVTVISFDEVHRDTLGTVNLLIQMCSKEYSTEF